MAEKIIAIVFLGICSWQDIRRKQISVSVLRCGVAVSILITLWNIAEREIVWWEMLAAGIPGVLMLVYSRLTREKLGEADGWIVIATGLLLQWKVCIRIIFLGCFLAFFWAVGMIISKKGTRHTQIPFVPFLLSGMILMWCGC